MSIYKKAACIILTFSACLSLSFCADNREAIELTTETEAVTDKTEELASTVDIVLSESNVQIGGDGAMFDSETQTVNITQGGSYRLSGTFFGGIIVNLEKTESVELRLAGVDIYNEIGAAINIASADKATVVLEKGTESILADGYDYDVDGGANACLFSKNDLTVKGEGTLTVKGNCNNGIGTKDDLKIKGGIINVSSAKNALKGNDSVTVEDGEINITGCTDGIKSDNETKSGKGFVKITGGNVNAVCSDDGIQAFRFVEISGGSVKITADDEIINCSGEVNVKDGLLQ